jgi:hypothetical protein
VAVYFRNAAHPFSGFKFEMGVVPPNWSFDSGPSHGLRHRLSWLFQDSDISHLAQQIQVYGSYSAGKGSFPPDLYDLLQQALLMKMLRVQTALEFGSGTSSIVGLRFSKRFVSVESNKRWASVTKAGLRLAGFSTQDLEGIVHAPVSLTTSLTGDSAPVWIHQIDLPQADFIYLDGPPLSADNAIAADIVEKRLVNEQSVILIDGRKANALWLHAELTGLSPGWRLLAFPFPSNDSLLIHTSHKKFAAVVMKFWLTPVANADVSVSQEMGAPPRR